MPRKKVSKTKPVIKPEAQVTSQTPQEAQTNTKTSQNKYMAFLLANRFFIAVLAVVIIGLVYLFRGLFIAAIVNNQPITRLAIIRELEKKGGKQVMQTLVTEALIQQEANKNKVAVTEKDIDQEIKKIEDSFKGQGQSFDQALAAQGMTRVDFRQEVRMQKTIEKILAGKVKVTEQEVKDYMNKNKESLQPNETEASVKSQIEQQKLRQVYQTWMADLQKKSKITYFVNY